MNVVVVVFLVVLGIVEVVVGLDKGAAVVEDAEFCFVVVVRVVLNVVVVVVFLVVLGIVEVVEGLDKGAVVVEDA